VNLAALPPGQDVPPGVKATDVITKTLASIPPGKLEEVLMQMKVRPRRRRPDYRSKVTRLTWLFGYLLFHTRPSFKRHRSKRDRSWEHTRNWHTRFSKQCY
jgi:hypothetical protein